jgi:uncharacterized membrane protein YqjE
MSDPTMGTASAQPRQEIDLRPMEADASLGELVSRLGQDLGDLLSTQVELAKVELRDEAKAGARAGGLLAAGGVMAHLALVFAFLTIGFVLDEWLPTWAAFLIVTAVIGIIAAVLAMAGRKRLQDVEEPLPRTRETLKDDMNLPQDVKEDLAWTAPRTN